MTQWLKPEQRDRLKRRLDELAALMALVETMHATQMPRRSSGGGSKPHPASRPPVNLGLVDLLDRRVKFNGRMFDPVESAALDGYQGQRREGVLLCLESWARMAEGEMAEAGEEHTPMADSPTISTEAGWLSQHVEWIERQQWVSELDADVGRIWKDLRQATGERPEYRPRCPECGATLTGRSGFWECGACGRDYRDERMLTSCQQPMTGERIAQLFGINYSTIRVWQFRGRLTPAVGDDGVALMDGKRHVFHVIDVLRLVDEGGAGVAETSGRIGA